jgi:hypothetical protein
MVNDSIKLTSLVFLKNVYFKCYLHITSELFKNDICPCCLFSCVSLGIFSWRACFSCIFGCSSGKELPASNYWDKYFWHSMLLERLLNDLTKIAHRYRPVSLSIPRRMSALVQKCCSGENLLCCTVQYYSYSANFSVENTSPNRNKKSKQI